MKVNVNVIFVQRHLLYAANLPVKNIHIQIANHILVPCIRSDLLTIAILGNTSVHTQVKEDMLVMCVTRGLLNVAVSKET